MAMNAADLATERQAAVAAITKPGAEATAGDIEDYASACILADSTAIIDHITSKARVSNGYVKEDIAVAVDTGTGQGATTEPGVVSGGIE